MNWFLKTGDFLLSFYVICFTLYMFVGLLFKLCAFLVYRHRSKINEKNRKKLEKEFEEMCKENGIIVRGSIHDHDKIRSNGLTRIEEFKIKRHEKYGWVVLRNINGKLFNLFYEKENQITINNWQQSKAYNKQKIQCGTKLYYPGFHIFLNKKDAEIISEIYSNSKIQLEIRKVLFEYIITTGFEDFILHPGLEPEKLEAKVVVADLRKVLP